MGTIGRIGIAIPVALGLLAAGWAWLGRPQMLVEAPSPRIACLSYAPFRDGETPFDPEFFAPPERIAADIQAMSPYTDCVRTYSVGQGLAGVLPAARAANVEVLMGIWLGSDPIANEREIETGIRLATEYAGTVRAVVVGNEVLLRRELGVDALAAYIDRVRDSVPVPVTYADVWEFWTRNAALADHVDIVTVHILPYWEDHPVAVENAIEHIGAVMNIVREAFPGQTLLVGETGWPSAGRIRDDAEPGRVEQARFVRSFLAYTEANALDYNLVEALDQGWKRKLEGAVGGNWGVLETDGTPKFPLTGPVRAIENPLAWFALSAALALLLIVAAEWRVRAAARGVLRALVTGAGAAFAGAVAVRQFQRIGDTAMDPGEWLLELALLAVTIATGFAIARWWRQDRGTVNPPAAASTLVARPITNRDGAALLGWLRLAGTLVYLFVSLCVMVDPRYRDLPVASVAVAAVGFMLIALRIRQAAADVGDRLLGWLATASGIVVLMRESFANDAAWVWAATGIAIGFGWLAVPRAAGTSQRAEDNPRSTEIRVRSSPSAPISTL